MKYVGVSTPAWTILGRPEAKPAAAEELPEPVAVDADKLSRRHLYPRPPTTVFVTPQPQGLPDLFAPPATPPPPAMEPARPRRTKKDTFPKEDRFKTRNAPPGPGPGYYQADLDKKVTASMNNFSFGYRFEAPGAPVSEKVEGADPPPVTGLYHPLYKHRELDRSVSFGKAPRDRVLPLQVRKKDAKGHYVVKELPLPPEQPGPGHYEVKSQSGNPTSRKGTFGQPRRAAPKKLEEAGAEFEDETSSPGRRRDLQPNTIEYNVQKILDYAELRSSFAASHPQKPRKQLEAEAGTDPGPLLASPLFEYKPAGPKWRFGTGDRPELNHVSQTDIGPGEYFNQTHNPHKKKLAQAKSFPALPKRQPGAQPRLFGEEKRRRAEQDHQLREQDDFARQVQQKQLFAGPAFSFRGKFDRHGYKEAYRLPGPGQYDFEAAARLGDPGRGPKFGTSTRPGLAVPGPALGPGSYEVDRSLGQAGVKFPRAGRRPMHNGSDPDVELGPGQYTLASTIPDLQYHEKQRLLQQSPGGLV